MLAILGVQRPGLFGMSRLVTVVGIVGFNLVYRDKLGGMGPMRKICCSVQSADRSRLSLR